MFRRIEELITAPLVTRIRCNHALEHATMHMLSRRVRGVRLTGFSDTRGFWIIGGVAKDVLEDSATQALTRLKAGETNLAIHPNCGTNLVVAGLAAGIAGALAMLGVGKRKRDKLERIPLAVVFATAALIIFQPLGYRVQERITTSANVEDMEIVAVISNSIGRFIIHRVLTRG